MRLITLTIHLQYQVWMRIDNMGRAASRVGGMFIDNEVASNTAKADYLSCSFCHLPIVTLYINQNQERKNRIDCEDEKLESYHLVCYDKMLVGYLRVNTKKFINEFVKEVFG